MQYYSTRDDARDALSDFEEEHRENGRSTISPKERAVMVLIREKYSGLNVIAILEEYKRTHANLKPISVKDATEDFIKRIFASKLDDVTKKGYRSRLRQFAAFMGDRRLDEVDAHLLDRFLMTKNEGGGRKTHWKGLSPFFKHAVTPANWITKNPMLDFSKEQKPSWGEHKREIYTPQEFGRLLTVAAQTDQHVLRYFAWSLAVWCG